MAFTHQMTTGGALLRTDNGAIQGECCCSAECTLEGSPVPAVQVTLTFAGGGTKRWLGKDWTSGESQVLCPKQYDVGTANERWEYRVNNTTKTNSVQGLTLNVTASAPTATLWIPRTINVVYRSTFAPTSTRTRFNIITNTNIAHSTNISTFTPTAIDINQTPSKYMISNDMFGQITTNSGITIAWSRVTTVSWAKHP